MSTTRRTLTAVVAVGWAGLAAGCAGIPLAKDGLTEPGALLFNGYSNPNADCYHCHNGDGTGKFLHGPNLHEEVPKASDTEIAATIRNGMSIMPAYEGKLSEAEIATLAKWLRAQYGGGTPAPAPAAPAPKS